MKFTNSFLTVMTLILASCAPKPKEQKIENQSISVAALPQTVAPTLVSPAIQHADSMYKAFAKMVLTMLKTKDYKQFATLIHPEEGLRFSPYGFMDTAKHQKFSPQSFLTLANDAKNPKVNWGEADATGEAILLTLPQYFAKFVYNADFLNAPQSSMDKVIRAGNSTNNLDKIFKNYHFSEHYFDGFDKKYQGMDWTSIRLVFKSHGNDGKLYLIAIAHGQWTS